MNKRIVRIITDLAYSDKRTTLDDLAKQARVSTRTIRNDLAAINKLLAENDIDPLELKEQGTIQKPLHFADILLALSAQDYYDYKLSADERIEIAALYLVSNTGYTTLAELSNMLFVSRTTVIDDLPLIKERISNEGLEVISRSSRGLTVVGKESVKRRYLQKSSTLSIPGAQEVVLSNSVSVGVQDLMTIKKIVVQEAQAAGITFVDRSFDYLCSYLGIAVMRMNQGAFIEPSLSSTPSDDDKTALPVLTTFADALMVALSQYCHIVPEEAEVDALKEVLVRCRFIDHPEQVDANVPIQLVTREFIAAISQELKRNLNDDYEFFEKLSNHLEAMYASQGLPFIDDPQLHDIVEEHPEVLCAVSKHLSLLGKYNARMLSPLEVSYIVIHICAALERKSNEFIALQVIVACHAGIATSQFLIEKLKKRFKFQIVDVVASHQVSYLDKDAADLVISTVPLKNCPLEFVVVSPMLREKDFVRVSTKIEALQARRDLPSRMLSHTVSVKGIMQQIEPIIFEYAPEKSSALVRDIRRAVRYYLEETGRTSQHTTTPWLHELLAPDHIQLDVEAATWKDAIVASALPLLKLGYIEERYIDAMIASAEEHGPYIVLTKGFAMPHDAPEAGALRVGMNLIRLKTPLNFGAEELDPVRFVCTLSAVDHSTHLKALFNLVNIFADDGMRAQLEGALSAQEIRQILMDFEYAHAQ